MMMRRLLALWLAALLALAPGLALADGGPWYSPPAAGQVPGTATNDSANAGNVGEYVSAATTAANATVTVTIATPGVFTWTGHGLKAGAPVYFTTTGALPTGLLANTQYFVIPAGLSANSFEVSLTPFGAAVNTSGTQSGTHTGHNAVFTAASTVSFNACAVQLTAGDWDVAGTLSFGAPGTSATAWSAGLGQSVTTLSDTIVGAAGPITKLTTAAVDAVINLPVASGRALLSGTTTINLVGSMTYTGGAPDSFCELSARRRR